MLMPLWAKVLIVAGVIGAFAWGVKSVHDGIWQRGYDARTAEYEKDAADAAENARIESTERDTDSENIADTTRTEAQAVVTEQQQTTAAAAERVRTIIKTVQVPAECPGRLPEDAEREGMAAVNRANEAGARNRKERRAGQ